LVRKNPSFSLKNAKGLDYTIKRLNAFIDHSTQNQIIRSLTNTTSKLIPIRSHHSQNQWKLNPRYWHAYGHSDSSIDLFEDR
jgi:hypothetical protein